MTRTFCDGCGVEVTHGGVVNTVLEVQLLKGKVTAHIVATVKVGDPKAAVSPSGFDYRPTVDMCPSCLSRAVAQAIDHQEQLRAKA